MVNELLQVPKVWENKLLEELATSQASSTDAIWELEAWITKQKEVLNKWWEYIAKLDTQLNKADSLHYMAHEIVKVAEQQTATTVTSAIEDYKKIENFT